MSYLVLARKSRPQTFEEIVGQRSVVKTLQNSLRKKRVAHAILFSGVRGVGKTTLARIMAKALNCTGKSNTPPCNTCASCREITEGSALDLYEIDGASNRGIQEIRELKEKIRFLPTSSRFKIIIIDEVHMLTTEAFNALLKTLEEPPEHVHFMFATTELHKIPITILSRCQRYELQRISSQDLTEHFNRLAQMENIELEKAAISLIVKEADGSVRDGLSLLDQVFSFAEKTVTKEDVIEVLGLIDRDILVRITRALLEKNKVEALRSLDDAFTYGIDIKRFTTDLLDCFRTLIFCKDNQCLNLLDMAEDEIALFISIAERYSLETLHLQLTLLLKMAEDIRLSPQPRLTLETSFLKIIEAGNVTPISELLNHLNSVLKTDDLSLHNKKRESKPVKEIPKKKEPSTQLHSEAPPPSPPPILEEVPLPPEPGITENTISHNPPAKPAAQREEPPKQITPKKSQRDVRRDWLEFTDYIKDRKIWMSKDLQRADSVKQVGEELHIHFGEAANCALLQHKENRRLLNEFALDFFQKELKVRFIIPDQSNNGEQDEENSPQHLRKKLINDPLVQMTVEIFGGQVGDIRVGPRSR